MGTISDLGGYHCFPPFQLFSVVSDPTLLFNLMAHTHVHTHTHTHGARLRGRQQVRHRARRHRGLRPHGAKGHRMLHWGRCGIGVRRHRKRHLRRGGIGCGIGGKTASGAWRHRGLRLQRLKGDDNRERHWGRGGIGGFGGIGGGIGGEAASGAASGASFFGSFGMATRCENAGSPVPTGERADVRDLRGEATTIYATMRLLST